MTKHFETDDDALHPRRWPAWAAPVLGALAALLAGSFIAGVTARPSRGPAAAGAARDVVFARGAEAHPARRFDPELAELRGRFAAYLASSPAPAFDWTTREAEEEIWEALLRFYERRSSRPAWFAGVTPGPQATSLVAALRRLAATPGAPAYPLSPLEEELRLQLREPTAERALELDLALTHAYLATAFEQVHGRLGPEEAGIRWYIRPRRADLAGHLERALDDFEVEKSLLALAPSSLPFRRLSGALPRYRRIVEAGGWPEVPDGPVLEEGDSADRVRLEALAARLGAEGYAAAAGGGAAGETRSAHPEDGSAPEGSDDSTERAESGLYGPELAAAVRAFQEAHGLEPDGKVGPATLEALNLSASHRLRQIEANLERWRWTPPRTARRAVEVNVPAHRLTVLDRGEPVLTLKVMVGKASWPTPIFEDEIEYAVLNPSWHVPESIARREILPKLRRNPDHLAEENLIAYAGLDGGRVSANEIDLAAWGDRGWAYRLRQPPGPGNPLGRVKFLFPNRFNVYLHDTNARSLFARADRAVSHGCVRVEDPFRLADALYRGQPEWEDGRLEAAALSGGSRVARLAEPVPISLRYFTVEVGEGGRVAFYDDVYGIDEAMIRALGRIEERARSRGYSPGVRVAFSPPPRPNAASSLAAAG